MKINSKGHVAMRASAVAIVMAFLLGNMACKDKTKEVAEGEATEAMAPETDGFVSIFNGKTLDQWDADPVFWRVEDGNLVGEITPDTEIKTNNFAIYKGGEPSDFELILEFRISEKGNSGVQYRSDQLDTIPFALRGYQADIDGANHYTGQNYEERKRATLAYRGEKAEVMGAPGPLGDHVASNAWQAREVLDRLGDADSLKTYIKAGDWNECRIVAKGNHLEHYINGILMSEVIDNDGAHSKASGKLGMQVHVGPPMKVEYRNIRIREF